MLLPGVYPPPLPHLRASLQASPSCPNQLCIPSHAAPEKTLQPRPVTCQHVLIGVVRDGEDVGRRLAPLLAPVGGHDLGVVHRQPLVGVDGDAKEARVGLG